MALTEIPIELSSTPSIVDGGNATAITISSAELVTVANGLTSTGKITADAGIDIDNFNIDGTTIALSSGSMALTTAVNLDLNVMDNLLENKEVLENQKPSIGCGIKWRQ